MGHRPLLAVQRQNGFEVLIICSNSDAKMASLIRTDYIIEGVVFHNDETLPLTHQGQTCGFPVSLTLKKR